GDAICRQPIHAERGPLRVVLIDPEARLLSKHRFRPGLRAGVAEDDRERRADLTRLQRWIRRLAHPRAVIAGVAHDENEDALILEMLDALEHRMEREAVRARRRWGAEGERERGDRIRSDGRLGGR